MAVYDPGSYPISLSTNIKVKQFSFLQLKYFLRLYSRYERFIRVQRDTQDDIFPK